MFRLEKLGFPTSIFINLKDDVPLCESYMFGTSRRRKWISKGRKLGYIRKETDNKPGYLVSVDQIQSAQPGLVPQLLGKLTSAHIWDAQVMMDHFSDLTCVYLMISTIQDETLS